MNKIRKTKILPPLLLAALALSMAACNKESITSHSEEDYNISSQNQERETSTTDTIPIDPSSDTSWHYVPSINIDETQANNLNNLFEGFYEWENDSLWIINDQQSFDVILNEIGCTNHTTFDFTNYSLLLVRITSHAHPSSVLSDSLFCSGAEYQYKINVSIGSNGNGYWVMESMYKWGVYPRINEEVSFKVNYIIQ